MSINRQKEKIPLNRLRHMYGVGREMYRYAKEVLNWPEEKAREMYILGLLHDAGYEFNKDDCGHGYEAADILERCGYRYADEIRNHSYVIARPSNELKLLWYADQVIDGKGHKVTFGKRLDDIAKRHGKESDAYKWCKEIIEYCKEHGFNDR